MRPANVSGARAAVLAAILFTPALTSADPPNSDTGGEDVTADDCERARRCRESDGPRTRVGCGPVEARCRVWRERHPEAPAPEE